MLIKIPSPAEFELIYSNAETRLYAILHKSSSKIFYLLAAVFLAVLSFLVLKAYESFNFYYPLDNYIVLGVSTKAVVIVSLSSVLALWPVINEKLFVLPFVLGGVSLLAGSHYFESGHFLTIFALVVLSFYYLRFMTKRSAWIYTFLFYTIFCGSLFWALRQQNLNYFHFLWVSKIIFLWLSTLVVSFSANRSNLNPWFIFNPVHGFRGVLWPEFVKRVNTKQEEYLLLWWKGYCNLILGVFIFALSLGINYLNSQSHLLYYNYIEFFFIDVAGFNILVGAARIFGFPVRDATRFVLLARTPADTWRRGSVYNYNFILRYVYFPVLSVLKFRFLTLIVSFSFFFMTHWGGNLFLTFFIPLHGGASAFEKNIALGRIMQTALQVILVATTASWWPISTKKLSETKFWPWVSVLLTHVLHMTIVYLIFVYWLGLLKL